MNDGLIISLAYPETVVKLANEWYSPFLRYLSVGNRDFVRAGHAALVLIDKSTGILQYYDFGRYITSTPYGRVRGRETDFQLDLPLVANIENNEITNLDELLKFFATHPKLTHGDGNLYASVCNAIDYNKAKQYITSMQNKGFIKYAAFIKDACNCSRFVTECLMASVTDKAIKSRLHKSKYFTPSTIGNVVTSDTENFVYIVSQTGELSQFNSTVKKMNRRLFLDDLGDYNPSLHGTLEPSHNNKKSDHAQWMSGIGEGAWFEIHPIGSHIEYRYKRISNYGNIDCDAIYKVCDEGFNIDLNYQFMHYSNCQFFHINQNDNTFRFEFLKNYK